MSRSSLVGQTRSSNQLHSFLREQLRETFDKKPPGERISSERILAKEFGVSTATVSRALQELQEEGILNRIPGKGTYLAENPSALGRSEKALTEAEFEFGPVEREIFTADTVRNLAVEDGYRLSADETRLNAWIIVQLEQYESDVDRSSEFWPQRIVSRLEYVIADQGGKTRITLGHTLSEAQCIEASRAATEENVNCIFFIVNDRSPVLDVWIEQLILSHMSVEAVQPCRRPPAIVLISLSAMQQPYFDTVSFDGEWGAYLAAAHLLRLGHREIAFLAPSATYNWLEHRILGFHRALRGFGVPVPRQDNEFGVVRIPEVPDGPHMWQKLGQTAAEKLAADRSVTAVLATNDQMASAFIERARELGRPIPESLSVVGYDDWFTSAINGLTTVHPPIVEIAQAALQLAKKQHAAGPLKEHVHLFLKPILMVRSSTQAPALEAED